MTNNNDPRKSPSWVAVMNIIITVIVLFIGDNIVYQATGNSFFEIFLKKTTSYLPGNPDLDPLGGGQAANPTSLPNNATTIHVQNMSENENANRPTAPAITVDLNMGPTQPDYGDGKTSKEQKGEEFEAAGIEKKQANKTHPIYRGNLITCVPPNPPNRAWIWLYRLDDSDKWQRISNGIGSINTTGYLKIDGLPVDITRWGGRGEPYRVEMVVDDKVVESTGNFQAGEEAFRIFPNQDNFTPWQCP